MERPYWLGTDPVIRQSIASLRLIWPDEAPQFLRRKSDVPGPQTHITSPHPNGTIPFPVRNARRRGHLVVVEGGKQ